MRVYFKTNYEDLVYAYANKDVVQFSYDYYQDDIVYDNHNYAEDFIKDTIKKFGFLDVINTVLEMVEARGKVIDLSPNEVYVERTDETEFFFGNSIDMG